MQEFTIIAIAAKPCFFVVFANIRLYEKEVNTFRSNDINEKQAVKDKKQNKLLVSARVCIVYLVVEPCRAADEGGSPNRSLCSAMQTQTQKMLHDIINERTAFLITYPVCLLAPT